MVLGDMRAEPFQISVVVNQQIAQQTLTAMNWNPPRYVLVHRKQILLPVSKNAPTGVNTAMNALRYVKQYPPVVTR